MYSLWHVIGKWRENPWRSPRFANASWGNDSVAKFRGNFQLLALLDVEKNCFYVIARALTTNMFYLHSNYPKVLSITSILYTSADSVLCFNW